MIYRVNEIFNEVSLTLANGGYPIFRVESIETIYNVLKSQEIELNEESEENFEEESILQKASDFIKKFKKPRH